VRFRFLLDPPVCLVEFLLKNPSSPLNAPGGLFFTLVVFGAVGTTEDILYHDVILFVISK
jgi:hypothetical protein